MHDYDPSWDYEIDKRPHKAVKMAVGDVMKEIVSIARELGLGRPSASFVSGLGNDIARYANGTYSAPVFVVDAAAIARIAEMDMWNPNDMYMAVRATLVHELGHAYLESCGVDCEEHDEDVVEQFARKYCDGAKLQVAKRLLDRFANG